MCDDIQTQSDFVSRDKVISYKDLQSFLMDGTFEFQASQSNVSYPIIERICNRLIAGHRFSPIKVLNRTIIDGHHRYLSHQFLGISFDFAPGTENISSKPILLDWNTVLLDEDDHDTEKDRKYYENRYKDKSV